MHSLHSYFLRPGDTDGADHLRRRERCATAGRSRPDAWSPGSTAGRSTTRPRTSRSPRTGSSTRTSMPDVIPPEEGLDMVALMKGAGNEDADALAKEWAALDARYVGNSRHGLPDDERRPSRARMWIRVAGGARRRPAGPAGGVHLRQRHEPARRDPGRARPATAAEIQMASLDHTIWFHRPFRADEWWLYDQHSPAARAAAGWRSPRSTPRTARWSRPWPRRG